MSAPYLPKYNATAARMAGGPQGAAYGQMGPQTPIFPDAGTYGNKSLGMKPKFKPKRYEATTINASQYDAMRDRQNYQMGREVFANNSYDAALADPRAQAGMFQQFYADSANAIAAPILRQFQQTLNSNAGMNASRFGGQGGSTEQGRGEFGVSDVFSRNLAEIIQSQGAQAVNAGMDFTGILGQRAGMAQGAVDNTTQLAGNFGANAKKKGGGIGGFLGSTIGAVAGGLAGNPGFGAALGGKIFGK